VMMNLTKSSRNHVERFSKPYSPSLDVVLLRRTVLGACSPGRSHMLMIGIKRTWRCSKQKRKKPRCIHGIIGQHLFVVVHIYRRKPPRVKTSCNQLGFHIKNILDT
jgi:hypothetical protein